MTISLHSSRFRRAAAFAVLAALSIPSVSAAVRKQWDELPGYLEGKNVTATMRDGTAHRGRFIETRSGFLILDGSPNKEIPRMSIGMLRVEFPTKSNIRQAREVIHSGYSVGFRRLFSPAAILGIVEVPVVTAYAAITLPFCALGDILRRREATVEDVQIIADAK